MNIRALKKSEAAKVDVELKDKLLAVAKKDHEQAKAFLGYATTTAPFDGEITRRTVDEQLEAKLDAVLEKVSTSGMQSLTEEEKSILKKASEVMKRRKT